MLLTGTAETFLSDWEMKAGGSARQLVRSSDRKKSGAGDPVPICL